MKAGITGHQNLGEADVRNWIAQAIEESITKYDISSGVTCLAAGADQLYARILYERNIPFTAIIPCHGYQTTFSGQKKLATFRDMQKIASNTIALNFHEPSEQAFFAAGKKVVELSHLLISVWDGKPARGLGGTADIVHYAISVGKPVVHINHVLRNIIEI